MLFMIIERFKDNDMLPIYKRVRDDGRLLRGGLTYIDSWIEPNFSGQETEGKRAWGGFATAIVE
jgi:hypothetical protein